MNLFFLILEAIVIAWAPLLPTGWVWFGILLLLSGLGMWKNVYTSIFNPKAMHEHEGATASRSHQRHPWLQDHLAPIFLLFLTLHTISFLLLQRPPSPHPFHPPSADPPPAPSHPSWPCALLLTDRSYSKTNRPLSRPLPTSIRDNLPLKPIGLFQGHYLLQLEITYH